MFGANNGGLGLGAMDAFGAYGTPHAGWVGLPNSAAETKPGRPTAPGTSNQIGCDISIYQGTVNFAELSTVAPFVIMRATVGFSNNGTGVVQEDSNLAENRAGAEAAGMKVGFYHYADPIDNSADKEANAFCNAIGHLDPGEFVALDYEVNYTGDVVTWCKTWMDDVAARLGVRPYIYLNLSLVNKYDWTPVIKAEYPLWLAYWDYSSTANPPATLWPSVSIRQYTDMGTLAGITTQVDEDVIYPQSPWPKFHANSQNTGVGIGPSVEGNARWSFPTNGGVYSSAAIDADGVVYIGSLDGSVYAVEGSTGLEKWSYATGDGVYSSPTLGNNGAVYVGSSDTNVYSLNQATGAKNWAFATEGEVDSSPVVSTNGTVYVGSDDDNVYAINGGTGLQVWSFPTKGKVYASPAIGYDGTVYIGSADGYMYAIDPTSGTAKWSYNTESPIYSSACAGPDGTVYFGNNAGSFYALNGKTGLVVHLLTIGGVSSSPAISGGLVVVGDSDNFLHAFAVSDFSAKWTIGLAGPVTSSPTIAADGTVYVGAGNNLYAISGATGDVEWYYATGNIVQSSPAIGVDGGVYFGSFDNSLYALGNGGLVGLSTASKEFVGGSPIVGTVTFASNAGSSGDLVHLSVENALAAVPATVTVPSGSAKATFTVSSAAVSVISNVGVIASYKGQTLRTNIELLPAALSAFRLTTPSIIGGTSEKGAVYLNGVAGPDGTTITLSSNNASATLPASVVLPAGTSAVNFTINSMAVSSTTPVTLSASDGVNPTINATLTLTPASVSAITATPATVIGGLNSEATITLNGKAGPSGNVVTLASNNSSVVVPATIKVLAGNSSVSFAVTTKPVITNVAVTLTATFNGASKTGTLTVNAPSLSLLRLTTATLVGGTGMNVAVYLTGAAPTGGATVTISSSSPDVKVPPSVIVPAGATAFAFPISSVKVTGNTTVTLTATKGPVTLKETLTLTP